MTRGQQLLQEKDKLLAEDEEGKIFESGGIECLLQIRTEEGLLLLPVQSIL